MRQLREQQRAAAADAAPPPAKKARPAAAAPKGSKLAAGYVDRSAQRRAADDDDAAGTESRVAQVQSLEDKLRALDAELAAGRLALEDYVRARNALVGGDVGSVHLVKGLDRRLLARVRRGEDVLGSANDATKPGGTADGDEGKKEVEQMDVDAALEALEAKDVAPRGREVREKKGVMAPPPPPQAGRKRTRDEILRDLKAARAAGATEGGRPPVASAEPALGAKFKKVGALPAPGQARIERDAQGREVLITVDADGRVKRKVRKAKGLPTPDASAAPLGADAVVPERLVDAADAEEDEGDIFEGVGAEYDPLGADDDSDSGSDAASADAEDAEVPERPSRPPPQTQSVAAPPTTTDPTESVTVSAKPPAPAGPRNYFGTADAAAAADDDSAAAPANPLQDPAIRAALKRAAALAQKDDADGDAGADGKAPAHRAAAVRTALRDRDDADVDLGFGASRFGDDEDEDGGGFRGRLAAWGGGDGAEGGKDGEKRGGAQQRKRGKKKRKGDKDSAKDVLAVLERRAKEGR